MKIFLTIIIIASIVFLMGSRGFQEFSPDTHVMDGKVMTGHEMPSVESDATKSDECAKSCFMNAKREIFNAAFFSQPSIKKFLTLMVFAVFLLLTFTVFRNLRIYRFQPAPVKIFHGLESTILRE